MLKINSISNDIFDSVACADKKVAINGVSLSRNDIVATGRLIALEYAGRQLNNRSDLKAKFNSLAESRGIDYATMAQDHQKSKFLFCAAIANAAVGKEAPASYEEAKKGNYRTNKDFWAAYNAIDVDVITPIFPTIFEDVASGGLMQMVDVPLGQTYQLDVTSNDVFLFEDSSWGSGRSTTKNYLYGKTITLTPKMYSCNATIKWYQDVVQGDAGRYYAAIMGGMFNKMYAIFISALTTAAADTKYVPSGLIESTYTSGNWINLTTLVAAANGVTRRDLFAFGSPQALSTILPVDANGNAIVGLQYGLGESWFERGYLPMAQGVDLIEVNPVIVPGTQNSSLDTIGLDGNIYIAAKGGYGYAPIYCAIAEGSPITMEATPRDTADFTIDINVGAMFDIKPVFASKIGVLEDVV